MRPPAMLWRDRVVEQVRRQTLEELRVALTRAGSSVAFSPARGARSRNGGGEHLLGHRRQLDRLAAVEAPLAVARLSSASIRSSSCCSEASTRSWAARSDSGSRSGPPAPAAPGS